MTWDPAQYRKFGVHRLRPALDLLLRVGLDAPRTVVDLGCGEGAVTRTLRERWPENALTGVDSSAEMLAVAARELPGVQWQLATVEAWSPAEPVDLLFSSATLHWVEDHASLFPRLLRAVKPGGAMAVQMPRNFDAPSHTLVAVGDRIPACPGGRRPRGGMDQGDLAPAAPRGAGRERAAVLRSGKPEACRAGVSAARRWHHPVPVPPPLHRGG